MYESFKGARRRGKEPKATALNLGYPIGGLTGT